MPVLWHILELTGLFYACKWNGIMWGRIAVGLCYTEEATPARHHPE